MILKCPLSVLERCPSYREFSCSDLTEKRQGLTADIGLTEVTLTVALVYDNFGLACFATKSQTYKF